MAYQQKALLSDLEKQTSEAIDYLNKNIFPLEEEALNWRYHPKKWSIAECIEHLRLASSGYFKGIEKGIEEAQKKGWHSKGTFSRNFIGKSMHFFVDPKSKIPIPAPGRFQPQNELSHLCVEAYLDQLNELNQAIRASYEIDLHKPKVTSPIISLLSMQLGDVYIMLVRHCWRHLGQIQKILAHPGFTGKAS